MHAECCCCNPQLFKTSSDNIVVYSQMNCVMTNQPFCIFIYSEIKSCYHVCNSIVYQYYAKLYIHPHTILCIPIHPPIHPSVRSFIRLFVRSSFLLYIHHSFFHVCFPSTRQPSRSSVQVILRIRSSFTNLYIISKYLDVVTVHIIHGRPRASFIFSRPECNCTHTHQSMRYACFHALDVTCSQPYLT